jgi:Ni,Fe-hydrogenase III large subunit
MGRWLGTTETKSIGPYHPYLLEPWKVQLETENDKVVSASIVTGYAHRGIEKLLTNNSYRKGLFIAERVCGICSAVHTNTFSQTVEGLFGIDIPERAKYLRVVYLELERLHSHYLNLAMMAHAVHRTSNYVELMLGREQVMAAMEALAGNRVNLGAIKPGGVRRDVSNAQTKATLAITSDLKGLSAKAISWLEDGTDYANALAGRGKVSGSNATKFGGVGPLTRGSGVSADIRADDPYAAYKELGFKIVIENGSDVLARTRVRARETLESIRLIEEALAALPEEKISCDLPAPFESEFVGRSEAPRGEVVYYMRSNKSNCPTRVKIRTPTFANHRVLMEMLKGQDVNDVQRIIESIDPCLSCTDR